MPSRKSSSYAPTYAPRGRGAYRSPAPAERRPLTVLLILLAAMAALAAFGWLQSRNTALSGGTRLALAAGTAVVERADGSPSSTLTAGQQDFLRSGDVVRVSANGRAVVVLGEAGSVELGPGTRVTLLEWTQQPGARSAQARLALHTGAVVARLAGAPADGAELIVETTVVTVVSQGGVFQCQALASDHVLVAVYEGSADVSMGEQSASLHGGEGLDAWLGQPLVVAAVPEPAPTPLVVPRGTAVAPTATLTDREKTLFPKVLTPTRPGDLPPQDDALSTGVGTEVWYTVAKGDTLYSIARQYGVSWEAIWEANREALPKPEMLQVGQRLRIPAP